MTHTCPVAAVTRLLGSRWTMQIIHHLREPRRYCELQDLVGEVNPTTFTQRLRFLEQQGLIVRREDPENARHVEYALTPKGRELLPILDALAAWAQKWLLHREEYPMSKFHLHPQTRPAAVALTVRDLSRLLDFYQKLLGLRLHRQTEGLAVLGAGGPDLLYLYEERTARRYRGVSGLYHFALLLPDRRELARVIGRLVQAGYPNAPTDHIMTKTTYLDDPEGNGIELYCESPEDGEFVVDGARFYARRRDGTWSDGREPLDLAALFRHLHPGDDLAAPMPPQTRMGHVHLHVGDLEAAMRFYVDVLGFDNKGLMRLFRMGMVSVDGYHHHIGLNTWQGEGAAPAPADAAGLRWFALALPDEAAREAVLANLRRHGVSPEPHELGWQVRDPAHHRVVLTVQPEVVALAAQEEARLRAELMA